ncbi:unnamed protein product, partial [Rotaria sp. Silwood2]
MQKVFLTLQQPSRYKLSHCRLVGGVGQKTLISLKSDHDCVIYVNDVDPPFEKLLDEWDNILKLHLNHLGDETKTRKFSIQFTIEELDFDLLPAPNYTGLSPP